MHKIQTPIIFIRINNNTVKTNLHAAVFEMV